MAMMAVMTPKRVKDVRELTNVVEDWEVKAKNLKTEHDIDLDPRIKVALLTAVLPADLQDYVFQWSDGKSTCEEMRDWVISMAINRMSMSKPIPMEVDKVAAEMWNEEEYHHEGDWEQESQEQVEIGYVGESCRKCGGVGHHARSQISNRTTKGSQKGRRSQTTWTSAKAKAKANGRPLMESAGRAANVVIVLRIVRKVSP